MHFLLPTCAIATVLLAPVTEEECFLRSLLAFGLERSVGVIVYMTFLVSLSSRVLLLHRLHRKITFLSFLAMINIGLRKYKKNMARASDTH